ncbi:MAG: M48 family metalloprotease [Syntrophaceae bacterium]|nr:M48 family metalloprotease [Syntrophaceae bacterium]
MKEKNIRWMMVPFCLLCLLFLIPACAVNPVTGKQELMLLSERDEINLGRETDVEIVKQYGIYEDPKLTATLKDMCRQLGRVSHRPQLAYDCKILDVSVVNAFAVPGGYVYFTRGILAVLNSEAELAAVMGHEIGHIAARHSARQYSKAQLAQMGLGVGSIFVDSPIVTGLAQSGAGMLFLRFSRDNEREADDLGVEYSSKAGYDAAQLAGFFETLERINPGSDRSGLPGWFSTHPSPEDRVQIVRVRAKEWQRRHELKDPKVNREKYLSEIDGLVYGDDPLQGYVEDDIFYHPVLRFEFPAPVRWKINNRPSQVQMISEREDAIILFSLTTAPSSREAAKTFLSKTGALVVRSEAILVNGLPSHRLISDIQTQKGALRVMSYFIEKDRKIYLFHGLTSINLFQNYMGLFENTMHQFKELTDPRKIDVKPDRIRIRTARTSDTLENTLHSFGVPKEKMKEMVLLNGGVPDRMVPANSLIKVVEKGR